MTNTIKLFILKMKKNGKQKKRGGKKEIRRILLIILINFRMNKTRM